MRWTSTRLNGLVDSFPERPTLDLDKYPFASSGDAGPGEVRLQVVFQIVIAGHLMQLPTFLMQPYPEPPALTRENV